ncbi:hypothetical protein [Pseudomonas sp. BF-B-25]|uniref:hypothetical protein n=1 Tax=Pseudomonas sp. BF-B-25 TaxID=2832355 RepID=UPI001CC19643|nr:hypothetical protein [Pseudomonas sp. BF-B-25]
MIAEERLPGDPSDSKALTSHQLFSNQIEQLLDVDRVEDCLGGFITTRFELLHGWPLRFPVVDTTTLGKTIQQSVKDVTELTAPLFTEFD